MYNIYFFLKHTSCLIETRARFTDFSFHVSRYAFRFVIDLPDILYMEQYRRGGAAAPNCVVTQFTGMNL